MRKSFLMLGMAVAALTSCTQSEVLEIAHQPERPIGFEPFVDMQTKATHDITDGSADFKEFYVFGAKGSKDANGVYTAEKTGNEFYLDHIQVKGGKGNWTYDPHKAWIANKTFRFAAYANGTGDGTSTAAKLDKVTFVPNEAKTENSPTTYVWGLDISDYVVSDKDLIAAVPEEKVVSNIETAPPSVGLTFKHLLAKVIIQLRYTQNAANNNLKLEVEPFSFNANKQGDCKVRYTGVENNTVIGATWTPEGDAAAYDFFPKVGDKNQTWTRNNIQSEVYVIPQSNEGIKITNITIYTKNSAGETTSTTTYQNVSLKIENHTDWLPGYVYRYIADVTPGEHYIHFTTSVNTWIDEDNRNQSLGGGSTSGN